MTRSRSWRLSVADVLLHDSFGTTTSWWGHGQYRVAAPVLVSSLTLLRRSVPSAADRLTHLAKLKNGWHGDGSVRLSQTALDVCADLLCRLAGCSHHLARTAFISPLSSGGVELEWDSLNSKDFLVSIPASGSPIEYLVSHSTSGDTIKEGVVSTKGAIRLFSSEICSQLNIMVFQPHQRVQTDSTGPSIQNTTREMVRYRPQHFVMTPTG